MNKFDISTQDNTKGLVNGYAKIGEIYTQNWEWVENYYYYNNNHLVILDIYWGGGHCPQKFAKFGISLASKGRLRIEKMTFSNNIVENPLAYVWDEETHKFSLYVKADNVELYDNVNCYVLGNKDPRFIGISGTDFFNISSLNPIYEGNQNTLYIDDSVKMKNVDMSNYTVRHVYTNENSYILLTIPNYSKSSPYYIWFKHVLANPSENESINGGEIYIPSDKTKNNDYVQTMGDRTFTISWEDSDNGILRFSGHSWYAYYMFQIKRITN